jgi:hypothetical protein
LWWKVLSLANVQSLSTSTPVLLVAVAVAVAAAALCDSIWIAFIINKVVVLWSTSLAESNADQKRGRRERREKGKKGRERGKYTRTPTGLKEQ